MSIFNRCADLFQNLFLFIESHVAFFNAEKETRLFALKRTESAINDKQSPFVDTIAIVLSKRSEIVADVYMCFLVYFFQKKNPHTLLKNSLPYMEYIQHNIFKIQILWNTIYKRIHLSINILAEIMLHLRKYFCELLWIRYAIRLPISSITID